MQSIAASLSGGIPAAVITLALGALSCFFGYRLRKLWVAVAGFGLGLGLGFTVASGFTDATTSLLIGVGVGVVLMLLCIFLYNVGIFILCGGCGAAVAFLALGVLAPDIPLYVSSLIILIAFILVGWLSLKFLRPVLIVVSGFSGAGSLVSGAQTLGLTMLAGDVGLICAAILGVVGILFQFYNTKGE